MILPMIPGNAEAALEANFPNNRPNALSLS